MQEVLKIIHSANVSTPLKGILYRAVFIAGFVRTVPV